MLRPAQKGATVLAVGSSSITVNLATPVVDDKSMLLMSAAPTTGATDGPAHTNVLGQLICSGGTCDSILFQRHGTTAPVGVSTTETLVAGEGFTNASAETLAVEVDGETITVGGARIVEGDLTADNGVVHVVAAVVVSSG